MNILTRTYGVVKSFIIRNHLRKADRILNDGERYDPVVNGWVASDHVNRYKFARGFLSKDDTVLDIACGTGYGSVFVSDVCKAYIGVDRSAAAIEYGFRKYGKQNVFFYVDDLLCYSPSADVVLSFETIEHVHAESIEVVLDRLVSLSKRLLIGSVPYLEMLGNNKHHCFFGLDESCFLCLRRFGVVSFFYQGGDGVVCREKPAGVKQLVFVLEKRVMGQ